MPSSPRFANRVDRTTKTSRGRTGVETTPIAIRSRVELSPQLEHKIRTRLASRLGHAAPLIERGTVRFEDINGPRGGIDTVCRIKLVLSGRPSVHIVETAGTPEAAFARAMPRVANAVSRERSKHGLRTGRERARRMHARPVVVIEERPAKRKPKRKRPPHRATVILETSSGRPSRKSTRKSANRAVPSGRKARAVRARKHRPGAKAARAKSQRRRARSR